MGKQSTILITILMVCSLSAWAMANSTGVEGNKSVQPKSYANQRNTTTCLACHGQLDYLRSVAKDTKDGYGHPVSAETVAQGLYVGPEFVNDRIHGRQSCEFCHGGDPKATDPKKAHAGMTKNPTADGGKKLCASCHQKTVDNFQNSIHFRMSGVKAKLTDRLGSTPHTHHAILELTNSMAFSPICNLQHAALLQNGFLTPQPPSCLTWLIPQKKDERSDSDIVVGLSATYLLTDSFP